MSPLAYLPMGNDLRNQLQSQAVKEGVTELPALEVVSAEPIVKEGWWCEDCEFLESASDLHDGTCDSCGCSDIKHISVNVVVA